MINSPRKQMATNLIAQIIAFAVNFGISFFLSPFLIKNVGREAYGFVTLGNNFVNYATLITIALNSMAGRFVTLKIHQDDFRSARTYYSSVIISNFIMSIFLVIPSCFIIVFLNKIVKIDQGILTDVRILWSFLFINLIAGLITSVSGIGIYAANRIDIQSKRSIESQILRAVILVVSFTLLKTHVWYIGLASLTCTLYNGIFNLKDSHKLYPELKMDRKFFDLSAIKELISSGIWNTVSRVGTIAMSELDLLLSNLFINASAMGTLSIAKIVPSYISSFMGSVVSAFQPQFTILYAENKIDMFVQEIRKSMRILLFFNCIVYGVLIGFLDVFFKLWLPSENDIRLIYILSLLTISDCIVSSTVQPIFNIFSVTNHLKVSSITVILTGLCNFVVTYLCLKYTNLGLYAIAGVSVMLCDIRNIIIIIPYGAKCLGKKWSLFYPDLLLNIASILISAAIARLLMHFTIIKITWSNLILSAMITTVIIFFISFYILLRKDERSVIISKIKRLILRRENRK